jgi:hypothetical protein
MNDERISLSEAAIASLGNEQLYRQALAAARRGDRDTASHLYVVMSERGLPYARQREVVDALFPLVRHARGFLTSSEQQRALRRFEQRRRP